MAVYNISRYPRELCLRDGACVTVRPLQSCDREALLTFFQGIPEDERFYMKEDPTAPAVLDGWTQGLNYDRALPLLAVDAGRIVADAVLIRHRGSSRAGTAEIRVTVDQAYRGRGLGVAMMRDLAEIAYDAELDQIIFECVEGAHDDANQGARFLGATEAGCVADLVKDRHGRPHDVLYLRLPLGKWWEWSQF